ncbi:fibronectin type III-like domain-contianing protein [Hymenobacter norwichensis]|uniref:fibronectin type III-like domain-contianing protein n=1 Tax=Hymenobacter norwichensis TaxID=223903 RepID=UPI00040C93B7|nr:hypothetical protein [Hymenobacter norwichensis]
MLCLSCGPTDYPSDQLKSLWRAYSNSFVPLKEPKDFQKISLKPGKTQTLTFTID